MNSISFIQDIIIPLFVSITSLIVEHSFFQGREIKETRNFSLFFRFMLSVTAAFASFFSFYNLGIYYDLINKESKSIDDNSFLLSILIIISIIITPLLIINIILFSDSKKHEFQHIKDFLNQFDIILGKKVQIKIKGENEDTINIPISTANNLLSDISFFIMDIISPLARLINFFGALILWGAVVIYTGSLPLSNEVKMLFFTSSSTSTSNVSDYQANYGIAFITIMLLCIVSSAIYSRFPSPELKNSVDWILRFFALRVFIEMIDDEDELDEKTNQQELDDDTQDRDRFIDSNLSQK